MEALEDYLVNAYDARVNSHDAIGGIRVLSLRIPFPPPGSHIERYHRKPLSDFPAEQRKEWFWTPESRRTRRCAEVAP
jgi:hypothetical protein